MDNVISVYSSKHDSASGWSFGMAILMDSETSADGAVTKVSGECDFVVSGRGDSGADHATELIGYPIKVEDVKKYTDVGVKKATTLVFVKGEDVIPATGANYIDHDLVIDNTALNVLRMINRSVLTVKASSDNPGTENGSTIMTYVHIND